MYTFDSLKDKTLHQVESWHQYGLISDDDYEKYCYFWQNSVYRFSSAVSSYADNRFDCRQYATLDEVFAALEAAYPLWVERRNLAFIREEYEHVCDFFAALATWCAIPHRHLIPSHQQVNAIIKYLARHWSIDRNKLDGVKRLDYAVRLALHWGVIRPDAISDDNGKVTESWYRLPHGATYSVLQPSTGKFNKADLVEVYKA